LNAKYFISEIRRGKGFFDRCSPYSWYGVKSPYLQKTLYIERLGINVQRFTAIFFIHSAQESWYFYNEAMDAKIAPSSKLRILNAKFNH